MSAEEEDYDGGFTRNTDKSLEELLSPLQIESLKEDERKLESARGLLLETINFLYKQYNIKGLRYFRKRVEACRTYDELRLAGDCLITVGRFHDGQL